jgi:hypothetical protein
MSILKRIKNAFNNSKGRKKQEPAEELGKELDKTVELLKELETANDTEPHKSGKRPNKGRIMLRNGDKIDHTTVKNSAGNYSTRINPINRHSEYGFNLRRAQKQNRKPGRVSVPSYGFPIFLTDQ